VFNITLQQGYSVSTMLAVAFGAILLCGIFYYRSFGNLRAFQWQTLLALRIIAILIVVLLLFRPVFSYHEELEEKRALVFAIDNSASMSISDNSSGVPRFNQARDQVQRWWEKLKEQFNLHLIVFSERAAPLDDAAQLGAMAADGKATSLSRALRAATKAAPKSQLEAVILLSDGVHNSAGKPVEEAGRTGVVVHTVGVGASLKSDVSYRDIQVTGLDCPDRLLLNNVARIKASVEGVGLPGRVVKVILEEDDKQIGEKELTLEQTAQQVEFEFRPEVKGRHTYKVHVPPASEEKIVENNQRSKVAMVVEPGMRVLYVEGTMRAEIGAIVGRFLSKDPDLEYCALWQIRPNVFTMRSNIEKLQLSSIPSDEATINSFSVFILGDLDSTYLKPAQQQLILKRVENGGGLIMLGGYRSLGPGGYAGSPLGEALPVLLGGRDIGQMTDRFLPLLTPDGTHHPIFANIAEFFPTKQGEPKVAGLPPLRGCTRVQGLRPGATLLASCPLEGGMPVLAVQPLGKGRIVVFTGDTTRDWQQGPRAWDKESPFLRFWGQTVRFLAGRTEEVKTEASIVGSTDKGYYEPDEPIAISAIVRDHQGEGTGDAKVEARIRGPGGRPDKVEMSTVPGPAGHYGGAFEPKESGGYEIELVGKLGEQTVTCEKIKIEVGRPNLEFEKLDLNEKILADIAAGAHGRYVHVTTSDHLIDQLDSTVRKRRVDLETRLYWPPGFWLLFVAVVTTEWVLRRKFQLR
jgi:uncharacterized membrane protein